MYLQILISNLVAHGELIDEGAESCAEPREGNRRAGHRRPLLPHHVITSLFDPGQSRFQAQILLSVTEVKSYLLTG